MAVQYVVAYFPHGATMMPEANGPYRNLQRAVAEQDRLTALEEERDAESSFMPTVVILGEPVPFEMSEKFGRRK